MKDRTNVFISHTWDTKSLAEELIKALEKQGIEAWVDFKDLRPGHRWKEELERAIDWAAFIVFLLTPESQATPWQEAEWGAALARTWMDNDKKLLPVVFGKTDPPPFLRDWVSLRIDPKTEASVWTREVLNALWKLRNEEAHRSGSADRAERQRRLDELRNAAEKLRQGQPDHPIMHPE